MNTAAEHPVDFLPLLFYTVGVLLIVGAMYGLSYIIGERHKGLATGVPYESGIKVTGSARVRFPSRFYLVAMLFVLFDLEVVFIFAWAVAARESGWPGYWVLLGFVAILVVGLVYEWRMGALDWFPGTRRVNGQKGVVDESSRRSIPG
ncbi:MAG: NADH:ubiquinone oxidoreductase subunit [Bacteroidetes bacterium]|nr:NADH:ubiquinone oxidoreductase subunit [Bacteroidota bacterium]